MIANESVIKERERANSIREKGSYTKYNMIIEKMVIAKSVEREYKSREERGESERRK